MFYISCSFASGVETARLRLCYEDGLFFLAIIAFYFTIWMLSLKSPVYGIMLLKGTDFIEAFFSCSTYSWLIINSPCSPYTTLDLRS